MEEGNYGYDHMQPGNKGDIGGPREPQYSRKFHPQEGQRPNFGDGTSLTPVHYSSSDRLRQEESKQPGARPPYMHPNHPAFSNSSEGTKDKLSIGEGEEKNERSCSGVLRSRGGYSGQDEADDSFGTPSPSMGEHPEDASLKKRSHADVERKRRDDIAELMNRLREIIPDCSGTRAVILRKAIDYIGYLEVQIRDLKDEFGDPRPQPVFRSTAEEDQAASDRLNELAAAGASASEERAEVEKQGIKSES